jgi:hypothetical protein
MSGNVLWDVSGWCYQDVLRRVRTCPETFWWNVCRHISDYHFKMISKNVSRHVLRRFKMINIKTSRDVAGYVLRHFLETSWDVQWKSSTDTSWYDFSKRLNIMSCLIISRRFDIFRCFKRLETFCGEPLCHVMSSSVMACICSSMVCSCGLLMNEWRAHMCVVLMCGCLCLRKVYTLW